MKEASLDQHNSLVFDHTQQNFRETFGVTEERFEELLKVSIENVKNFFHNNLINMSEEETEDNEESMLTYSNFINLFCAYATNLNEAVLLLTEMTTYWHIFRRGSVMHLSLVETFGGQNIRPVIDSDYLDLVKGDTDKLYKIFKVDKERYKAIVEQILNTEKHCLESYMIENKKNSDIGAKSFTFEYWLAQSKNLKELYLISTMFGLVGAYNEIEFNQLNPLKYE